jgi:hypothetical protein
MYARLTTGGLNRVVQTISGVKHFIFILSSFVLHFYNIIRTTFTSYCTRLSLLAPLISILATRDLHPRLGPLFSQNIHSHLLTFDRFNLRRFAQNHRDLIFR